MILLNKTIYSLRRSTITYLILIGVIFVAAIVQELSGFGFGTLAMAILPIFLAYKTCNMLVLSASLLIEIYTIIKLFKYIQWKLVIIPTFVSVIISILGTHLMLGLSTKTLSIIMACFLWIMAGYLSLIAPKLKVSANLFTGLIAGAGNGIVFKMVPYVSKGNTGSVTGFVGAAGGLGGYFPPIILGFVKQHTGSYALGFALIALLAIVCLLLLWHKYIKGNTKLVND